MIDNQSSYFLKRKKKKEKNLLFLRKDDLKRKLWASENVWSLARNSFSIKNAKKKSQHMVHFLYFGRVGIWNTWVHQICLYFLVSMPYVSHAALTGWFNTHSRPVLWKQISFHSFNVGAEFQHVFTEIYAMHLSLVIEFSNFSCIFLSPNYFFQFEL